MPRDYKQKECAVCSREFTQLSGVHKFCSDQCRGKWKYITGDMKTENQYLKISGNWQRYLSRLLYVKGRKRDFLTREILLEKLIEQNYKCAITGVDLTCLLEKGTINKTNASIDRIDAGGSYAKENIQLVCRAVNSFRNDVPMLEFIEWCRKVVNYADAKTKKVEQNV